MKAFAILNILCAIFAPLHCSSEVKCKKGRFMKLTGEGKSANQTCSDGEDRCFAAICTAWDQPGNDVIYWDCVGPDYEFKICGLMRRLAEEFTKSENTSCECPVGEKGVNMTNVAFQLPPEPTNAKKRLQCKVGYFNATGYGNATIGNCFGGYENCYAASCAKGNKHERTVFGCANGTSCAAINAKVGKEMNSMVNCKCLFGKAGVDMSNKNLTPLSMMPTTTPTTTTTSKPTTTTTVKTLATTTVKPTTKTAKPFGTKDKAKMTTVEEPTTTMEANRSAHRSIATFCTVLIAIGILAFTHSLFGGHHFTF